jgi:hypothetical protein
MPTQEMVNVSLPAGANMVRQEQSLDVTDVANEKELLKHAVQSRYFALVSEGTSPNSAAASAIREIGSQSRESSNEPGLFSEEKTIETTQLPANVSSRCEVEEGPLPRLLTFDTEDAVRMQRSSSAPGLSATPHAPLVANSLAGGSCNAGRHPGAHRNKDVWKTFGIHLPAGRSLKRLYGGAKLDPVPGAIKKRPPKHVGPPSEMDIYIAVNNINAGTAGLQYRKSMNIFDICHGEKEYVRWGDTVEAYRVDASWLQVGDRYLPTVVNRVQLLKRWTGPEKLCSEGLKRQYSLPPLRGPPPEVRRPQFCVGGISYAARTGREL